MLFYICKATLYIVRAKLGGLSDTEVNTGCGKETLGGPACHSGGKALWSLEWGGGCGHPHFSMSPSLGSNSEQGE